MSELMSLFVFRPYCYLSFRDADIIVFNEIYHKIYSFKCSTRTTKKIIDNTYIEIYSNDYDSEEIMNLIHYFSENNCGRLIKYQGFLPFIHKRCLFNENKQIQSSEGSPINYMSFIKAIYLIGEQSTIISRQIAFPSIKLNITSEIISNIMQSVPYSINTYFFIASDNYTEIINIIEELKKYNINLKKIIVRSTYEAYKSFYDKLDEECQFEVLLSSPFDVIVLKEKHKGIALVYNRADLDELNRRSLMIYRVLPVFSSNISDNALLSVSKDDILSNNQTIRKILLNGKYNTSLFGLLYVDGNGNIYESLNSKSFGNIYELERKRMLEFLLSDESAWLQTRQNVVPCKECVFRDFCSPISEYERFANDYKICHGKISI